MLSEEAVRIMLVLWKCLGLEMLSGVLLFTMNELAGVDVCTKTRKQLKKKKSQAASYPAGLIQNRPLVKQSL